MSGDHVLALGWLGKLITLAVAGFDLYLSLSEVLAIIFITIPVGILSWWKVYDKLKKKNTNS